MSLRNLLTPLLLAALCVTGCGILKKKTDASPSASIAAVSPPIVAPVAPPPEAPVAVAEPALDEAAVPAPQDFEDEAFEKVTTANFKTELQRLTKEISATTK